MDIGQNIGIYRPKYQLSAKYRPNIGQNENTGIDIDDQYVGANISVSAKISAGRIYRYQLDPYRSNPIFLAAGYFIVRTWTQPGNNENPFLIVSEL